MAKILVLLALLSSAIAIKLNPNVYFDTPEREITHDVVDLVRHSAILDADANTVANVFTADIVLPLAEGASISFQGESSVGHKFAGNLVLTNVSAILDSHYGYSFLDYNHEYTVYFQDQTREHSFTLPSTTVAWEALLFLMTHTPTPPLYLSDCVCVGSGCDNDPAVVNPDCYGYYKLGPCSTTGPNNHKSKEHPTSCYYPVGKNITGVFPCSLIDKSYPYSEHNYHDCAGVLKDLTPDVQDAWMGGDIDISLEHVIPFTYYGAGTFFLSSFREWTNLFDWCLHQKGNALIPKGRIFGTKWLSPCTGVYCRYGVYHVFTARGVEWYGAEIYLEPEYGFEPPGPIPITSDFYEVDWGEDVNVTVVRTVDRTQGTYAIKTDEDDVPTETFSWPFDGNLKDSYPLVKMRYLPIPVDPRPHNTIARPHAIPMDFLDIVQVYQHLDKTDVCYRYYVPNQKSSDTLTRLQPTNLVIDKLVYTNPVVRQSLFHTVEFDNEASLSRFNVSFESLHDSVEHYSDFDVYTTTVDYVMHLRFEFYFEGNITIDNAGGGVPLSDLTCGGFYNRPNSAFVTFIVGETTDVRIGRFSIASQGIAFKNGHTTYMNAYATSEIKIILSAPLTPPSKQIYLSEEYSQTSATTTCNLLDYNEWAPGTVTVSSGNDAGKFWANLFSTIWGIFTFIFMVIGFVLIVGLLVSITKFIANTFIGKHETVDIKAKTS